MRRTLANSLAVVVGLFLVLAVVSLITGCETLDRILLPPAVDPVTGAPIALPPAVEGASRLSKILGLLGLFGLGAGIQAGTEGAAALYARVRRRKVAGGAPQA